MATESWAALGAVALLAVAGVVQVAAWLGKEPAAGRCKPASVALGARVGAAVVLLAAVVLSALGEGGWSPESVRQVAIDLALATVVAHLILIAWVKLNAAGPVADLTTMGLALLGGLLAPRESAAGGALALPLLIEWVLTLFGAGAVAVAGSTALLLSLRAALVTHVRRGAWQPEGRVPQRAVLHHFLYQAAALGTLALGAGLTVGLWWTWQTAGALANGDPRQAWSVAATLLAAASLWAARLGRQSGRWTALLAGAAAGLAVTGLLAGIDLHRILTL